MAMPKITLKCDINQDIQNAIHFIKRNRPQKYRYFLFRFLPNDLHYILNNKISASKKDKIIKDYTKLIYKERKKEIAQGLSAVKKNWAKIEKQYFKLVSIVFKNHPWPKGRYTGIASIFGMFPRYIKQKMFFFPATHKIPAYSNKVIAHAMLHFIFFDYIEKRYGFKQDSRIIGKPNNYIWQLSEAFNNVIEDWGPYKKIIKDKPRPYQGTEKIFKKMSGQWSKKQDIDRLLDNWLK